MKPGSYNLDIYRGDSYAWEFKVWDDEGKTEPFDLSGATPKAEIRDKPGGTTIFELECMIVDTNVIRMELSAELSRSLPTRGGGWDLQLSYPDDQVVTILAGTVMVTPDYTDSTVATTP